MLMTNLPGSGTCTSRLGFGCSGLVGGLQTRHSLRLLHTAYDAGIRHFDVAPMYGFGTAERTLGRFLRERRDGITVTTKFGLLPYRKSAAELALRGLARRVLRAANVSRPAGTVSTPPELLYAPFTAEAAAASLTASLRALGTDHVHLLLLHEATAEHLRDDRLLRWLQDQMQAGTVGAFGVASTAEALPSLLSQRPAYCHVVQSEWSAQCPPLSAEGRFHITHRALQGWLHSGPNQPAAPHTAQAIAPGLLLAAALHVNPGSIVLFSSSRPERIRQNVSAACDPAATQPAMRLYVSVQQQAYLRAQPS